MRHEPGNTLTTRASRRGRPRRHPRPPGRASPWRAWWPWSSSPRHRRRPSRRVRRSTWPRSANFGHRPRRRPGLRLVHVPAGPQRDERLHRPVRPGVAGPDGSRRHHADGRRRGARHGGVVLQSNSTYQVTYNGAPLYTFVGDTTPGQVSGNNIGGFTVVQVSGAPDHPHHRRARPTTGSTTAADADHRRSGPEHPPPPALPPPRRRARPAPSPASAAASSGPASAPGVVVEPRRGDRAHGPGRHRARPGSHLDDGHRHACSSC